MRNRELGGGGPPCGFTPARVINQFSSREAITNGRGPLWATCAFSPVIESRLFLGDDCEERAGHVAVVDVSGADEREPKILHVWRKHTAPIFCLTGVPGDAGHFISASSDGTARLWDVETGADALFVGHSGTVRCVTAHPSDPHIFATGSRDGNVLLYDSRNSAKNRSSSGEPERSASLTVVRAHEEVTRARRSLREQATEKIPSITSLVFIDDNCFVSSSEDSSKSGLRIWDRRKISSGGQHAPVSVLQLPSHKRRYGVSSLCLDRFGSSLFAAVTCSRIYEFAVGTVNLFPVGEYIGAEIDNFYHDVVTSPVSDHLACGSKAGVTLIWDLQEKHKYDVVPALSSVTPRQLPFPSFKLHGHGTQEVLSLAWSCNGRYLVTMGDMEWRVWDSQAASSVGRFDDPDWASKQKLEAGREYAEKIVLTDDQQERLRKINDAAQRTKAARIRSALRASPRKTTTTPTRRTRTEAFFSPLKEVQNITPRTPNRSSAGKSPAAKRLRFSPRTPTKTPSKVATPRKSPRKTLFNPFYFEYPTEVLPKWIDVRRAQLRQARIEAKKRAKEMEMSPATMSRRKVEDWLCKGMTSPAVSRTPLSALRPACENMLSLEERQLAASPRKLVIKPRQETEATTSSRSMPRRRASRKISDYFKVINSNT